MKKVAVSKAHKSRASATNKSRANLAPSVTMEKTSLLDLIERLGGIEADIDVVSCALLSPCSVQDSASTSLMRIQGRVGDVREHIERMFENKHIGPSLEVT